MDEIFKVQKRCALLILDAPFQARTLPLFYKLGWLPINHICIERRLILFKRILDVLLTTSLRHCYDWNSASLMLQDLGCLIPRTNNGKQMFFFNALRFWKNISDNDFAIDLNKFRSNYFDCIIGKFTPASLKQTEYSRCYSCDFKSYVILSFIKFLVSCYFSIWNACY